MKVYVVFDWVYESPVAVYTSEDRAAALCDRRFNEIDSPNGNTTSAWLYDEFELDVDPAKLR